MTGPGRNQHFLLHLSAATLMQHIQLTTAAATIAVADILTRTSSHQRKRKRDQDDSDLYCATITTTIQAALHGLRLAWIKPKSVHWVIHVLGGYILQTDQEFAGYFRLTRTSFNIFHGLLGMFLWTI
jgi:hypothetical protein